PLTDEQRRAFTGLRYFEPDPRLRFEAILERSGESTHEEIQTSDGKTQHLARAGVLRFTLGGHKLALPAYQQGDDLFIAFGVARITLARPERRNAFDAELIAAFVDALGKIDLDARAVILDSEGDAFCAGADLNWMKSMVDFGLAQNIADSRALAEMFRALDGLAMPLVARVQGPALGGGAGLVAVADIAVASTEAVFGFTEVRLGIIPAV